MKKRLNAKVIQVPAEAVNRIDPAELEKCEACAAEMVIAPYTPMDFFENPVNPYEVADRLYPYMERMDVAHEILSDNGMVNTLDGHIRGYNDSRFAAVIPAVPINEAGKTSTLIVNTLNNGLRFCGIGEDCSTVDLGPVTEACIIGNAERPSAILIPICNPRGIVEGYEVIKDLMDRAMERQRVVDDKKHCCIDCASCGDNANYPEPEVTYTPRGWYI